MTEYQNVYKMQLSGELLLYTIKTTFYGLRLSKKNTSHAFIEGKNYVSFISAIKREEKIYETYLFAKHSYLTKD